MSELGEDRPAASPSTDDADAVELAEQSSYRLQAMRRRHALVDWSQLFANLLVIVAIGLAVATYSWEKGLEKRERSADRVALLYSEQLSEARATLFRLWLGQDLAPLGGGLPREVIDALVEKTIAASGIEEAKIADAIVSLANYLDGLEACIAANRCDAEEIEGSLGGYARNFHCLYKSEIVRLRDQLVLPSLGRQLAVMVERTGGCSA